MNYEIIDHVFFCEVTEGVFPGCYSVDLTIVVSICNQRVVIMDSAGEITVGGWPAEYQKEVYDEWKLYKRREEAQKELQQRGKK